MSAPAPAPAPTTAPAPIAPFGTSAPASAPSTTEPSSDPSGPTPTQLVSKLITTGISIKTLTLLGNLAFGNAGFKKAVAEQPSIITLANDFATSYPTPENTLQVSEEVYESTPMKARR